MLDAQIGRRIRQARMGRQITQETLAGKLEISCQQLHKYERGINRISASRLVEVANHLGIDIVNLLSDEKSLKATLHENQPSAAEIRQLIDAFCLIPSSEARVKIIEMVNLLMAVNRN
jgi:transcriptional regulator with XRE-family HTH domain